MEVISLFPDVLYTDCEACNRIRHKAEVHAAMRIAKRICCRQCDVGSILNRQTRASLRFKRSTLPMSYSFVACITALHVLYSLPLINSTAHTAALPFWEWEARPLRCIAAVQHPLCINWICSSLHAIYSICMTFALTRAIPQNSLSQISGFELGDLGEIWSWYFQVVSVIVRVNVCYIGS